MKNELRVSIIVLNWDGLEDTIECLDSLLKIDYSNYEIIVVDNNSSGGDVVALNKFYGSKIRLIENDRNVGFAEGNNIALREVLREGLSHFVLLLNNDTVVSPRFLNTMMSSYSVDARIGVVGNKILNLDGSLWSAGIRYLGNLFFFNKFMTKSGFVDEVVGCCFLIRRDVLREVGLLDDLLFAYGEETDFCMRAKNQGYKVYFCNESSIVHKVSKSTEGKSGIKVYLLVRNKIILGVRYYKGFRLLIFFAYITAYVAYNIGVNYRQTKHILKGVRDGYRKNLTI